MPRNKILGCLRLFPYAVVPGGIKELVAPVRQPNGLPGQAVIEKSRFVKCDFRIAKVGRRAARSGSIALPGVFSPLALAHRRSSRQQPPDAMWPVAAPSRASCGFARSCARRWLFAPPDARRQSPAPAASSPGEQATTQPRSRAGASRSPPPAPRSGARRPRSVAATAACGGGCAPGGGRASTIRAGMVPFDWNATAADVTERVRAAMEACCPTSRCNRTCGSSARRS